MAGGRGNVSEAMDTLQLGTQGMGLEVEAV